MGIFVTFQEFNIEHHVAIRLTVASDSAYEEFESELGELLFAIGVWHLTEQPISSRLFQFPPMAATCYVCSFPLFAVSGFRISMRLLVPLGVGFHVHCNVSAGYGSQASLPSRCDPHGRIRGSQPVTWIVGKGSHCWWYFHLFLFIWHWSAFRKPLQIVGSDVFIAACLEYLSKHPVLKEGHLG